MKPGDSMLHYRIGELLGVGGMGEVHQATDSRLDREVAVKILPENVVNDADRRQRFEREARTLAALQHPNIATIHGLEKDDGRLFLIMELVRGEDLRELLQRRKPPVDEALDIALQIATGLEEAHAQGIVHRDLKPANVKLTPDGKVKILDFGLARAMQDPALSMADPSDSPTLTAGMTRDGSILGTAAYMSPEQARGYEVDARADIWAFGCLLFEMLAGAGPFSGATISDTIASVLKTEPDWTRLPKGLSPALHRVLRRCLAKDPRERLHSVADARIELIEAAAEPAAVVGEVGAQSSSRRLPLWITVLGWLAAAAVLFSWLREPTAVREPVRMDVLTYSTRDWAPDVSPDGNLIAFVSDRDGTARIWLKQLAGGGEAPLTEGSDDTPRFSPDGSQILFARDVADTRHLYRAAVVGGQARKVLEDATEGDWSPDGEQVAFLRTLPDSLNLVQVGVADVRSGTERILHTIENRLVYGVRWSPDGSRLAVDESSLTGNAAENSTIDLIDVETGAMTRMSPTVWAGPFSGVEWSPDGRSFIFGQAPDVISHVSGKPSLVMQYDLDSQATRQLFWSPMRLPKGGWGYSALTVLGDGSMVMDEQVVFAELVEVDLTGEAPDRVLNRSLGIDRQPVYSADGRWLLFSSNRSGNVDLWLRDMTTGRLSQLTDDPAGDWDPAFTSDGNSVLWSSNRGGHMEVWTSALDGSQARQVTDDGVDAENPTMTSDGEWIVYASSNDTKRGIWKIRPDGTDATLLAPGSYLLPEVSPDGRWVVFMSLANLNNIVNALDLATGRMLPFNILIDMTQRNENLVFGRARWSPDGTEIIYIGQDTEGNSGALRQVFTPDAPPVAPPVPLGGFDPHFTTESLGVSPDGTRLIISALHERRVLKQVHNVPLEAWR